MDGDRDGAKKRYEPPRVLRLDAAGEAAGTCWPSGSSDAACAFGAGASGVCLDGGAAVGSCAKGATLL